MANCAKYKQEQQQTILQSLLCQLPRRGILADHGLLQTDAGSFGKYYIHSSCERLVSLNVSSLIAFSWWLPSFPAKNLIILRVATKAIMAITSSAAKDLKSPKRMPPIFWRHSVVIREMRTSRPYTSTTSRTWRMRSWTKSSISSLLPSPRCGCWVWSEISWRGFLRLSATSHLWLTSRPVCGLITRFFRPDLWSSAGRLIRSSFWAVTWRLSSQEPSKVRILNPRVWNQCYNGGWGIEQVISRRRIFHWTTITWRRLTRTSSGRSWRVNIRAGTPPTSTCRTVSVGSGWNEMKFDWLSVWLQIGSNATASSRG